MVKIFLQRIRTEKGLTDRDLEKLSGVSKSEISGIEREEIMPSLDIICKLAKALEIDIDNDLFECE